jgi:hypothetical protein
MSDKMKAMIKKRQEEYEAEKWKVESECSSDEEQAK